MRRSSVRRASSSEGPSRRAIAAVAALVLFGVVVTATQVASAGSGKGDNAGSASKSQKQAPNSANRPGRPGQQGQAPDDKEELDVLADDCSQSRLDEHDGFQEGERCVETQFGEVGAAEDNPTLLIVDAPEEVEAGEPFTIKVSTRNLVRDRFLAAADGGYFKETSLLNAQGLVRGHFHTACRMLESENEAPEPDPAPAFFVATEDRKGSATPDTVDVEVAELPDEGTAMCSVWAGDGSHRIPMMERANQAPPFDAVRIEVK